MSCNETAPTIISATIGTDSFTLTIEWEGKPTASMVGTCGLTVDNEWQPVELSDIVTRGTTTVARLSRAVMEGEEFTLSYVPGDFGDTVEPAIKVQPFSDYPVINDSAFFFHGSPGSVMNYPKQK